MAVPVRASNLPTDINLFRFDSTSIKATSDAQAKQKAAEDAVKAQQTAQQEAQAILASTRTDLDDAKKKLSDIQNAQLPDWNNLSADWHGKALNIINDKSRSALDMGHRKILSRAS